MYSRSLDGGTSWSEPIEFAGDRQGEQNLAVYGDTIHVVWNGDAGYKGRYYRSSSDGGLTWSPRETSPLPEQTGGLQGAPAIVVDSTGTAHILYTDSPRLYYITRRRDQWSSPILIAGPDNTGATSEIDFPMLAITEGNQLHALYTRDAKAVYYQHRAIDAPYEASEPWPSSASELPTETPTPILSSVPTATPWIRPTVSVISGSARPASNSMPSPILIGTLLSLVLVVGTLSVHLARSGR
jgi:hypothetical protein